MIKNIFLYCVVIFSIFCSGNNVSAADLPGAKDHPLLKRYGGSEIVGYDLKQFDIYELQTSTFKRFNLETKQREYLKPPLKIEGAVTRIWYEAVGNTGATELLRNYQNELKAKSFTIIYDSTQDRAVTNWSNFMIPFSLQSIQTNRSNYIFYSAEKKGIRVCSAKMELPEGNIYVSLTAVEWYKDREVYKAKHGAYIAVDIIEVKPMTQNMVTVSADEMSKALTATGRVALYGIYFDSNKTEIKPESKPALEEIVKLLKKEMGLKLHVVGHTDNVGGLEFNMNLSKHRAESVVAALVKQYGIASNRLTANGVAYLAPVAVNSSEKGRAKNRRVELVPW